MRVQEINSILRKSKKRGVVSLIYQSRGNVYVELRRGDSETVDFLKDMFSYCSVTVAKV